MLIASRRRTKTPYRQLTLRYKDEERSCGKNCMSLSEDTCWWVTGLPLPACELIPFKLLRPTVSHLDPLIPLPYYMRSQICTGDQKNSTGISTSRAHSRVSARGTRAAHGGKVG